MRSTLVLMALLGILACLVRLGSIEAQERQEEGPHTHFHTAPVFAVADPRADLDTDSCVFSCPVPTA